MHGKNEQVVVFGWSGIGQINRKQLLNNQAVVVLPLLRAIPVCKSK
jgi:hypothetical protein